MSPSEDTQFTNGNQAACGEVPTAGIRAAFQQSGITAGELARRLGWTRPDDTRVRRQLGLTLSYNTRGYGHHRRETMKLQRALEIIEALGIDPVDVEGL